MVDLKPVYAQFDSYSYQYGDRLLVSSVAKLPVVSPGQAS
jgi:hypothetical protein